MHTISKAWQLDTQQEARSWTRLRLLRNAWLVHVLKRAINEVSKASDQDYRAFGFDRHELLASLRWLREQVQSSERMTPVQLSVAVAGVAQQGPRQ